LQLFAEHPAQALIGCSEAQLVALRALAAPHGVPLHVLGSVGGDRLRLHGHGELGLYELRAAHSPQTAPEPPHAA
jgi:hypothetical protein